MGDNNSSITNDDDDNDNDEVDDDVDSASSNTMKLLNNGHTFCRAFVTTIEGWPLPRGFI